MVKNENEYGKEISLEGFLDDNEPTAKWVAKASVFTNLFSELYCALHPDDKETAKEDLMLMTIESHLLNQQYNDLGFLAGNRLIILVEAQSTWSENIVVRVLLYVVQTWYKYIKRMKLDIYDKEKIALPEAEMYVIYTGEDAKNKPDEISLKDSFFNGKDVSIDCKVKVLVDGADGDIISQYVRFCHIFNEQIRLHGRTRKAVEETIRICRDENVLREYLERQWEEVVDIMLTLFDEETMMKNHDATVERRGMIKGEQKGRKEGIKEGRKEGIKEGRKEGIKEGKKKGIKEGKKEGHKEMAELMNYLWSNGRGDEAQKVSDDEKLLDKLLAEFNATVV